MPLLALKPAKGVFEVTGKLVKARIHVHNGEILNDDVTAVFVSRRYSRLEAL